MPKASLLFSWARNNPPAPFKPLPVWLGSPWFGQFTPIPPGASDVHISLKHQVCDTFIVRATVLREGDLEEREEAEGREEGKAKGIQLGKSGKRNVGAPVRCHHDLMSPPSSFS